MKLVLLFLYLLILHIVSHRKHSRRTKKQNGFRKDIISPLPRRKTKLLDMILNKAVSEIMDNMGDKRKIMENIGDKRKIIENIGDNRKRISSKNDAVYNLDSISNGLQSSLRTMKRKINSGEVALDPFDGQYDPYKYANIHVDDTAFKHNNKVTNIVDLIQQNGLSTRKDIRVNDNDLIHHRKDPKSQELTSSSEEFRKDNNKKYGNSVERVTENKNDDLGDQEQVSEILPVGSGHVMLLKDHKNNEEVKLDVPNIHFDAKVNSSDSRDKILKNLKDVMNVMSHLSFNSDDYTLKNMSLTIGDKRDGAEKLTSNTTASSDTLNNDLNKTGLEKPIYDFASYKKENDERAIDISPEKTQLMYPSHGSYFIQHKGNIYRIEKVQHFDENGKEEENKESSNNKNENSTDDWKELEIKNSKSQSETSKNSQSQPETSNSGDEPEHQKLRSDMLESSSNPLDNSVVSDIQKQDKTIPLKDMEYKSKPLTTTDEIKNNQRTENKSMLPEEVRDDQETDNTYEIKHNNKIFRITEITEDKSHALKEPRMLKEASPQSRSISNHKDTLSSQLEKPQNVSSFSNAKPVHVEKLSDEEQLISPKSSDEEQLISAKTISEEELLNSRPSVVDSLSNSLPSAIDLPSNLRPSAVDLLPNSRPSVAHVLTDSRPSAVDILSDSHPSPIGIISKANSTYTYSTPDDPSMIHPSAINRLLIDPTEISGDSSGTTFQSNADQDVLNKQKETIPVEANGKYQENFATYPDPGTRINVMGTDKHDIVTDRHSSAVDDDYVTYVFKTMNNTNENDITSSLKTTLVQDVIP